MFKLIIVSLKGLLDYAKSKGNYKKKLNDYYKDYSIMLIKYCQVKIQDTDVTKWKQIHIKKKKTRREHLKINVIIYFTCSVD